MKTLVISILLLSLSTLSPLFAQRTYYKTETNSIYGVRMAYMESNDPYYKLGLIKGDSTVYLGPEEVREYGNRGGQIFISAVTREGEAVFLELLEDGPLKLLYLLDKEYKHRYFVKFMEADPTEIFGLPDGENYFRDVLDQYWAFCEENRSIIETCEFKRGSLRRTIKGHNECAAVFFPEARWEIQGGISFHDAVFNPGSSADGSMPPGAIRLLDFWGNTGFQGHIIRWSPIIGGNLSWGIGLQTNLITLEDGVVFSFRAPFDRDFEVDIKLLDLAIPMGVRYTGGGNRLRPYVEATVSPNFLVRNDWEIIESIRGVPVQGIPDERNVYVDQLSPLGWSIRLAAGAEVQTRQGQALLLSGGWQRRETLGAERVFNFWNFFVMAGYSLNGRR